MYGTNVVPKLDLEGVGLNIVTSPERLSFDWVELSPRLLRTSDPADAFSMPAVEYQAFDNSCRSHVTEFRAIIEDCGVDFDEVSRLASSFDALRQLRRTNVVMLEHNDDR